MAGKPKLTSLCANEIYCLRLKGLTPSGVLVGNSVQSMGFIGNVRSSFRGIVGGEIGVVGVSSELRQFGSNSEFLFVGSGVHASQPIFHFTSAGDAQELYCHMDAGYSPRALVFGNIAYSVGAVGGITGTLKTLMRGEIKEFSDVFKAAFRSFVKGEISELTTLIYDAREQVFDRLQSEAAQLGADEVVGIKTYIVELGSSLVEIFSVGTAVRQAQGVTVMTPSLPAQAIIRDKDTWVSGGMGLESTAIRAGD